MIDVLDGLTLDWSNFDEAGRRSRELLHALSEDKKALAELVERSGEVDALFEKCERHFLLDYMVLYDALERGFRLRLHFSTENHRDRPHDHRFSFSSRILRGGYRHTWYRMVTSGGMYEGAGDDVARRSMDILHPDERGSWGVKDLQPILVRDELPGNCYSLHHTVIHTTFTMPMTVSLFIRGPAEKERSVIMDVDTGKKWWRFGAENEGVERRASKRMGRDHHRRLCDRLRFLGVI